MLSWNWVTMKLVKIVLAIGGLVLYEGLAITMMYFGLKKD